MVKLESQLTLTQIREGLEEITSEVNSFKYFRYFGYFFLAFTTLNVSLDVISGTKFQVFNFLFMIIFATFLSLNYKISAWYQANKYIKTNSAITEKVSYFFDEINYKSIAQSYSTTILWDKIYKISEKRKYILIFLNAGSAAVILPKAIFDDSQLLEFKNIIKSHPSIIQKFP